MGKYRIKVDEQGKFCAQHKSDKDSFITFWRKHYLSRDRMFILFVVGWFLISVDYMFMLTTSKKWESISWHFATRPEFGVVLTGCTYWYTKDTEVHELIDEHKKSVLKEQGKFEKVIFESN